MTNISPNIQKALDAARGSQTGAIVACAFGVERDAIPRFTSTASLTSDGYLMANFIGADGRHHLGAFVGSYEDFKRGVEGLADHVKLTCEDRALYAKTLNAWVSGRWANVEPVQ